MEPKLSDRVFHIIKRYQDRVLLSDGSLEYTGADILVFINKIKPLILKFSCRRGRIGILIPNSPKAAMAILAVVALERIPVILNPSTRRKQIEEMLPGLNIEFLIVAKAVYPELDSPCSFIHLNLRGDMVALREQKRTLATPPVLPPEDTAVILYTSGTEGAQKGVQLSDSGIGYTINYLINYFGLNESTVSLCMLPISHTMGLNTQFFPTFFAGGKSAFYEASFNLGRIYRLIIISKSTFVGFITEFLQLCYEEKIRRNLAPAQQVQHVQIAGGVIRDDHLHKAMDLFPNAIIHKGYGQTEAIRVSMINNKDSRFYQDTAGHLLPGQKVEIRDEEGNILPENTLGEIYLTGPNIMLGYENRNDSPIKNGFLRSGDLGSMTSDGLLMIHGRKDSIFKVNGVCVSGKEIENAVRSIAPPIRDVKCLTTECKGGVQPILFVELLSGLTEGIFDFLKMEFRLAMKKRLKSSFKIPSEIYCLHSFPRTHNGKIRTRELINLCKNTDRTYCLGEDARGLHFFMIKQARLNGELLVRERRKYTRIVKRHFMAKFRIKQYEGLERPLTTWDIVDLRNISEEGMFFYYSKYLRPDSLLDLKIEVTKPSPIINCVGKVIRTDNPQSDSMCGIAIKFADIREQEKELLMKTILFQSEFLADFM